ncbi:type II toxin-antitoxin system PrlF family antitoxin (plasmid) [Lactobacillus sp. ESL0731]|uniref:type II toxin-antitoxin system PrlF family antitoxin n=1 Tax=unclassified Lactobacillus TaxID=2620435 RepID=UPI0023F919E3|nr:MULTISPECIES: type II toxin-antitoxin system PrlF family antitoxin [unclassified Lactobacillus]WEV52112.1 type II toxin-antitoxin system PrlF family antitoxin [Lactobacillus sp. ESL0700]WEV63255.1 type II toxin-antitoxin system PrlF family antitoxin [Lactobacillus sp. ESL0731]
MQQLSVFDQKVISKITSKNQVTLPQAIREILAVKANDNIEWNISSDGKITITAAKRSFWQGIDEQQAKYGSIDTTKIDWGSELESED